MYRLAFSGGPAYGVAPRILWRGRPTVYLLAFSGGRPTVYRLVFSGGPAYVVPPRILWGAGLRCTASHSLGGAGLRCTASHSLGGRPKVYHLVFSGGAGLRCTASHSLGPPHCPWPAIGTRLHNVMPDYFRFLSSFPT